MITYNSDNWVKSFYKNRKVKIKYTGYFYFVFIFTTIIVITPAILALIFADAGILLFYFVSLVSFFMMMAVTADSQASLTKKVINYTDKVRVDENSPLYGLAEKFKVLKGYEEELSKIIKPEDVFDSIFSRAKSYDGFLKSDKEKAIQDMEIYQKNLDILIEACKDSRVADFRAQDTVVESAIINFGLNPEK